MQSQAVAAQELADQRRGIRPLTAAQSCDHGDRECAQPPDEMIKPAGRGDIGPVQVVHQQQQGSCGRKRFRLFLNGEYGRRLRILDAEPASLGAQHLARERGGRVRDVAERPEQQRPGDTPRHRPLERTGPRAQNTQPSRQPAIVGRLNKPSLADPRRTTQHERPASAHLRTLDRLVNQRKLGRSLEQRGRHGFPTSPHRPQVNAKCRGKSTMRSDADSPKIGPVFGSIMLKGASVMALLVCPGFVLPAQASSIFFIRGGNVWVADPDGSRQTQVTTDGTNLPYVAVASAKQGTMPLIAWERSFPNSFGTVHPDGTGLALSPANDSMHGDNPTHTVSLDPGGDRVAFAWGHQNVSGAVSGPQSVGVDGSNLREIGADGFGGGSSSVSVTFGDPGGSSLLFDSLTSDYGGEPPASCAHSAHSLVRQVPQPAGSSDANTTALAFYCGGTGIDLLEPALRPDGQLIVASAHVDTLDPGPSPNPLASGKPRLVMIPLSGGATASNASPVTFITADGLGAVNPDFSPDGTQISFALSSPSRLIADPASHFVVLFERSALEFHNYRDGHLRPPG